MSIIDGRALAEKIRAKLKQEVALLKNPPRLGILEVGDDPVIGSFVKIKKKVGESLGVLIEHTQLPVTVTTDEVLDALEKLSAHADGVIVQLPLPEHIDTDQVLDAIPLTQDIDVLSKDAVDAFVGQRISYVPPVAGAVAHIMVNGDMSRPQRRGVAVVIGKGRLVGQPVAQWLSLATNLRVVQVDDTVRDLKKETLMADVIISGAGVPRLITPDMVSPNVILIDAGTSEQAGKLVGDIDPACAEKAELFTPVPGGVGPVTVAVLYENLLKTPTLAHIS